MRIFATNRSGPSTPPIDPPTTYEAEAVALFAQFTNTYGTTEKELINDLIIDLKAEGIWDKLDHFYLAALSGKEEQLIDWKNPTETLTDNGYDVTQVPYKGLAPQIGTYYTGIIPSVEMNINSSFYSFKCGIDFNTPNTNYILGADDYYRVAPLIYNNQKYYRAFLFNSFNYNVPLPSGTGYDNTVVINRTASNSSKVFINNQTALSTTTASVSLPTTQIKIGGEIDLRGNSHNNFVQHFACGSGLTDAQGLSLTTLIDNFANTQKALDTDYIEVDGIRTTIYQNAFKCVLGQQCIWNDYQNIYYSTDLGNTISATIALPTEGKYIDSAHIFDNGKIIFSTIENKIYKTTTALTTITEMLPTKNGSPYTIHTPNDSRYPGEYYKGLWMGQNKSYLADGREIKIWGNYCNVFQGASPVLVWYSFGDDIKVAFEFGQNQYVTDNGIAIPITGGTLLGDATQTIKTRHMHSVHQDPNSLNDFYSSMGDYDRTEFYESNIVKHIYDPIGDTFTTSLVVAGSAYSRVKISTLDFISTGELLFASDATYNLTNFDERGWFKTSVSNLGTPSLWTRVYYQGDDAPITLTNVFSSDFLLGGNAATGISLGDFNNALINFSEDLGVNSFVKNLQIPGNVFYASTVEISPRVFVFLIMTDYYYKGMYSIKVDLTNSTDV